MDLRCEQCGKPVVYSGHGRPPTRFCSKKCKETYRLAAAQAETRQEHEGRLCERCGRPIPLEVNSRARTCSRACGNALQNAKKRAAKRAEWLVSRPPCLRCEGPIPESRQRHAKYCSTECKKKDADERWRARSPHYNRQYNYGITSEQWEAQLEAQDGRCAICRSDQWPGKDGKPHADHDHALEIFVLRGILCGNCNQGLGMFGDDPSRLRAAADYLEREM